MEIINVLAPCGLDCGPYLIRLIPFEPEKGQGALDWFKDMGWLSKTEGISDAIEKKMYCKGCRGERNETHWAPECVILTCCVDKKNLESCNECDDFPCKDLLEWGEMASSHQDAIENLKDMRKNS